MACLLSFYAPQVEVGEALQSELQGKSDARDENVSTLNHDIVELRSELSHLEGNLPTLQREIVSRDLVAVAVATNCNSI